MTRKDFELIAKAVHRCRHYDDPQEVSDRLDALASDLAGELAAANPNFDTARFLKACGSEA